MSSNMSQLMSALFGELDKLDTCETPDEINAEVTRAKAVEALAGKIIDGTNTVIRAVELRTRAEDFTLAALAPLNKMLPAGDGDEQ